MKRNWLIDFILLLLGKEFTLVVENRSDEKVSVTLLDAHNHFNHARQKPASSVRVKVWLWGYRWLLSKMVTQPFQVGGFRIESNNQEQLGESMAFIRDTGYGMHPHTKLSISPADYLSPYQEADSYSNVFPFSPEFDGYLKLSFDILPNTKVKMRFSILSHLPKMKIINNKPDYSTLIPSI